MAGMPGDVVLAQAGSGAQASGTGAASAGKPAGDATTERYWYDGNQRRTVRIDPEWIADFRTKAADTRAAARTPLVRADGAEKAAALQDAGVSEVLRDDSGSPRALPGGVIVRVREADLRNARERLEDEGLRPVRALDPEERYWLVEAPAGIESLELANRLHESGRFESASPNWWRPRTLK